MKLNSKQIEALSDILEQQDWKEVEFKYKPESVIIVDPSLDLVTTACNIAADKEEQIKEWVESELINPPTEAQVKNWRKQEKVSFLSIELNPFVFIQEVLEN
ncbi:MAG: DUF2288 family protein [Bdellovibrionota bacterium]